MTRLSATYLQSSKCEKDFHYWMKSFVKTLHFCYKKLSFSLYLRTSTIPKCSVDHLFHELISKFTGYHRMMDSRIVA